MLLMPGSSREPFGITRLQDRELIEEAAWRALVTSPPPSPTSAFAKASADARGEGKNSCSPSNYAGVKNGSGAPSVGLNTTLTFWPIFNVAMSQSTMLVCTEGPSFNVT